MFAAAAGVSKARCEVDAAAAGERVVYMYVCVCMLAGGDSQGPSHAAVERVVCFIPKRCAISLDAWGVMDTD